MEAGIVSYGAYVPRYRITPAEIGRVWGADGAGMGVALGVVRKSVPSPDEDTITISTEALRTALVRGASIRKRSVPSMSEANRIHMR